MKHIYLHIIKVSLPIFVIWLFMLAISNNFDLSNVRINLYATIKRFENVSSDDFLQYINDVSNYFSNINFDFNFNYVDVNSISSFFTNIGVWFNGVFSLIVEFFKLIGNVIRTLGLGIAYIFKLIINIFTFVFNPVQL